MLLRDLVILSGNGIEPVDQINTIFAPVKSIDLCVNRVYAINIMFYSKAEYPAIMSNHNSLIAEVFFLNLHRVHEYRKQLLTPQFCM